MSVTDLRLPRRADLLGQDTALAAFDAALDSGRVGTSYLLYGPAGVGRSLGAALFGAALLCASPRGCDPCGTCPSCHWNAVGTHGDFLAVSGATGPFFKDDSEAQRSPAQSFLRAARTESPGASRKSIPVRTLRRLQALLALTAVGGGRKVVLLDGMEEIEEEGAASLLKTLEEPPPRTTLLLLAESQDGVMDTILSRCQRVRFRPLAPDLMDTLLQRHGGDAFSALSSERRQLLARIGQGSVGRSLDALAAGLHENGYEAVRALFEGGPRDGAGEERALHWVLAPARDLGAQRARLRQLAALLLLEARDRAAQSGSTAVLQGVVKAAQGALESVQANVSPELVLTALWVRLRRALATAR
jgi:DNA polymerase-3 subunit delta'